MFKQYIIVRKDLNMSSGKMSAQVAHAAMAFITVQMRENYEMLTDGYRCNVFLSNACFEEWINGPFTKCVLEAKNRNHLLKAKQKAEEMGLIEGIDFFCIKDNCYTELSPEEIDENGIGRTLTCIGFVPRKENELKEITKKYQLYKGQEKEKII